MPKNVATFSENSAVGTFFPEGNTLIVLQIHRTIQIGSLYHRPHVNIVQSGNAIVEILGSEGKLEIETTGTIL